MSFLDNHGASGATDPDRFDVIATARQKEFTCTYAKWPQPR